MRFLFIIFLLFYLVVARPFHCYASDSTGYSLRHYTDEDGLPQNSILSIHAGDAGFVWMATEDGLVRFDGEHFFIFNKTNTHLTTNRFSKIIASIFDDNKYALDIDSGYLLISGGKALRSQHFHHETEHVLAEQKSSFNRNRGDRLIAVGKNTFYTITADSIFFHKNGLKRKIRFTHSHYIDKNFFLIGEQLLYMHTPNTALVCDVDGGREVIIKGMPANINGAVFFHAFLNTKDRSPFVVSDDRLYRLDPINGTISATRLLDRLPTSLEDMRSVYQDDATGNVFVGTASNGLYIYQKKSFRAYTHSNTFFYAQTVLHDSLTITPQGVVFGNNRKPEYAVRHDVDEGMYGMFTDEKGFIWMYEHELLKIDPSNLKVIDSWRTKEDMLLIAGGLNKKIWLASRAGNIYQLRTDMAHDSLRQLVTFPRASFLLQQDKHTLWVGAYNALYLYHPDTKRTDTVHAFDGKYVRSIYLDREHYLWVTTYEDGVFLMKDKRVVHFPYDAQNYITSAHCMLEDAKGFFWITTNKGLFQISRKDMLAYANGTMDELFYVYYGKENGFNTNEFNGGCQPCGVKLANGYFSMPSLNGMVWFNPDSFKTNLPDKNIFVDRMELDGTTIPAQDQMHFAQHFGLLNIWVSTPYFGDHRNVHLSYRIVREGKPVYWPVPASGIISLQDLPSGNHVVEIIKNNGFGKGNVTVKKISILVAPYWYETWWFFVSLILLLLILLYLLTNLRTKILRQRNRWLELQIKRRTRKLEHTLDTLNASQHALARQAYIQQRLIAAISHDVRTPLKFLTAANKRIYNSLLKITNDQDLLEMSRDAGDASERMQDYLSNLLQYVKTTSYQQKTEKQYLNIEELITVQADMFRQLIKDNGSRLTIAVVPKLEVYTNGQLLAIILHNIIDNAAKNTLNGSIHISCEQRRGSIAIEIGDTGGGVSASLLEWVNSRTVYSDNPSSQPVAIKDPDGIGLFIVKELAGIINAELHMTSDHKTSTRVSIILNEKAETP